MISLLEIVRFSEYPTLVPTEHQKQQQQQRRTSVEDSGLDIRQVLGEALVLLLDLEGQLSRVAQHHHVHLAGHGVQQVQRGQHEHGGLAHARLGLADNVHAQHGLGNALVLHCGAAGTGERDTAV